jgi:hypothetical protein
MSLSVISARLQGAVDGKMVDDANVRIPGG